MAEVEVDIVPATITAAITASSVQRLGLKEADNVVVIVKATEVIIGTYSAPRNAAQLGERRAAITSQRRCAFRCKARLKRHAAPPIVAPPFDAPCE